MFRRIDHVALHGADFSARSDFIGTILTYLRDAVPGGVNIAYLRLGDTEFDSCASLKARLRAFIYAWRPDDFDGAVASLQNNRIGMVRLPHHTAAGSHESKASAGSFSVLTAARVAPQSRKAPRRDGIRCSKRETCARRMIFSTSPAIITLFCFGRCHRRDRGECNGSCGDCAMVAPKRDKRQIMTTRWWNERTMPFRISRTLDASDLSQVVWPMFAPRCHDR